MRKTSIIALVLSVSAVTAVAQTPSPASVGEQPTPAERKIAWAEKSIQTDPGKFQGYNQLALGLVRRVRENSNEALYSQAEDAVKKSLRLAPDNFEALKIQVTILLGKHEFAQALERGRTLNRRAPDDVPVWGYIAEAAIGLGDYQEAEKAAQWMLDLRPGNVPGLIEGAALRKLYGDVGGALDFLKQAYQQTPPNEAEDAAWLLTEMADLERMAGKTDDADKLLREALGVFPGYYRALEGRARVLVARRDFPEAVDLLRQRNQNFPNLESAYALAEALEGAGRRDEAAAAYSDFEAQARRRIERTDNVNRELIFYYADHAHKPSEALRIARLEASRRHDVLTLDSYAWALYANADYAAAQTQMSRALAVGVREAEFFYHAARIASKLGDRAQADRYFKQARDLGWLGEETKAAGDARPKLAPVSAARSSVKR
jgi:tetratricopeptide (TPR) repeat protein